MAFPADLLFDVCADVRDAVIAHYISVGADLPERRYIANGQLFLAVDCDQFTVACERVEPYTGDPASVQARGNVTAGDHTARKATLALSIARCVPGIEKDGQRPKVPTADEENAASAVVYADHSHLVNAVMAAHKDGQIGRCANVLFLDWSCPGAQGKYALGTLRVVIGLE